MASAVSSSLHPLLSLLFLLLPSSASAQESQILLQLKRAWNNPSTLSSWSPSSGANHCGWFGVRCDGTANSVTHISLASQSISGGIPPVICNLSHLSHLDLGGNSLSGQFPTSLYRCSSLAYLDLSQNLFVGRLPPDIDRMPPALATLILSANNFTGDVPASIGRMSSLRTLSLDNNLFNGSFPAEISNLSDLEVLQLAYNPFAGQGIPPEFGSLKNLSYLWMTRTNLVGEIPTSLEKLAQLQHLDLAENSLTGAIPSGIWMLENLQYIYLYKNNLTGEVNGTVGALGLQRIDVSMNRLGGWIPSDFGKLRNLSVLLMYYNQFSGEIPSTIGTLPSLSDLRLYGNQLVGVLPPELGMHSPLWNLEVDDNMISGILPEHLCARGAFSSLIVFDNNMTGNIPESLGRCATLDNLQLHRNRFYGDLPAGIWSLVNLSTVILRDNNLSGTLPDTLPWNLTRLDIQNNRFSGKIPSVAGKLLVLLAGNNLFSGEIPASLTGISKIQSLSLGGNLISGTIPSEMSMLKSLTDLNLSSNQLVGDIPTSIADLPVLTSLDLSNNRLTGEIPAVIGNLKLNFLNLSHNNLDGEVPFSFQNQAYAESFASNPDLCSWSAGLNLRSCSHQSEGSNNAVSSGLKIMFIVLGALFFLVASAFGFLVVRDCRRRKDRESLAAWKLTSFHSLDFNESKIVKGLTEENLIGNGGAGEVYKVEVGNRAGEVVAVKKIWNRSKKDAKLEREFVSEIQILSSIRHTNIVKLLCCISSADSKLLVYEYMRKGSLDRWLHETRRTDPGRSAALDWPRRLGIAVGAARGLCYMHHDCSPPIVHRDVKSSNILLDSEFRAKVADFGLARMLVKEGEPCSVTAVAGSFGYMAPECAYATKVNAKMDVYSFGVVLLELTTGREAGDGGEQGGLADWAWHHFQMGNKAIDAIDGTMRDPAYLDDIAKVLKLGLVCTGTLPSTRPTMKEVVEILSRCERANWNAEKTQAEHDVAPLLQTVRGSRHKFNSNVDDDDDCGDLVSNV